jgi:MIP family channel proteins
MHSYDTTRADTDVPRNSANYVGDGTYNGPSGLWRGKFPAITLMEPFHFEFIRACLAELFSTMVFVWVATTIVIFFRNLATFTSGTQLMIGFGFGLAIAVLVFAFGGISGGHINPAVSLSLFLTGRISALRWICYTIAQMIGAVWGAAWTKAINPGLYTAAGGAVNALASNNSKAGGVLAEILGTMFLCFIVNCACDRRHVDNNNSALFIGLTVALVHWALIPITGCSINPARSFGTAVIYGYWHHHWIWWIGPWVGAIFAALFYELLGRTYDEPHPAQAGRAKLAPPVPRRDSLRAESDLRAVPTDARAFSTPAGAYSHGAPQF